MTQLLPGILYMLFVLFPVIPTYAFLVQVSGESGAWLFVLVWMGEAALVYGLFMLIMGYVHRWLYRRSKTLEDAADRWIKGAR